MTPQSNVIVGSEAGSTNLDASAPSTSDLKRRMFSVMATSVGSRSIDEAPKKPADAARALQDEARVLGLGDRAAVAEHEHVVRAHGGVVHRLDLADALLERPRRVRADRALRRQAHVRHQHVGAGPRHGGRATSNT